ncbi:hypothetical protein [Acidiphilium acidophilum]|uniref:hypothetical protein n=1 Tax=Acidiphilium acidophilum TaxID=76588 RepID=UPI002E8E6852|nr:hypothetical protein [Acidiphilium acidophilum]
MSSIAPTHPHHPVAQFVRILRDLVVSVARKTPSPTMSDFTVEILLRHLDFFIRRLTRAIAPSGTHPVNKPDTATRPKPAPPRPRPNPNTTPGMIMRCPAWLQHLTPRYLPDAADDIAAATAALTALLAADATADLIAQTPKSAPTLRSLCRMFGIAPPSWLQLPKPVPEPKPPRPSKPRLPRKPRDYGFTLVGIYDTPCWNSWSHRWPGPAKKPS